MRETEEREPMLQPFTFEADNCVFACQIEQGRSRLAQAWWWFTVSGESHRFAPFQPVTSDTVDNVQARVLSYYRELVARRALPLDQRASSELRRKNLAALRTVRDK